MARIESSGPENRILLVEGQNDKHVVLQICNRHLAVPDFYIRDAGGINELLGAIVPAHRTPGREVLGILADTDDMLQSRWDEVAYRLNGVGITLPMKPDPEGTIVDGVRPRVGVWLMPDNTNNGEVEDFVSQMIPDGDPVWPLARNYIDGIPTVDRKFASGKTARARIYAWLAARAEPRMMGSAISSHDLKVDGELCRKFVAWLTRLFQ